MIAYHGSAELKEQMVAAAVRHRELEILAKGCGYWDGSNGCAVGCSIETVNRLRGENYDHDDHGAFEPALGVPYVLARLQDGLFESLPAEHRQAWPERFFAAIPVGADLSGVGDRFMHYLLVDPTEGVLRFARNDEQRTAIMRVAALYERRIAGNVVGKEEWEVAAAAAYAADACSAAVCAAVYAAYAAAAAAAADDAAAYAADDAAADADAADADADAAAARVRQAEKLLELMAGER